MNFLALKYFRTVATELNITHAAQKLYISQQALSFHIRNLEQELGVDLFTRNPRLALTDAGRCLLEASEQMEHTNTVLNDKLNQIRDGERGELRIGISFTRGQFILPSVLPEYARKHKLVHISIFEEHTDILRESLINGEIDFWISAEKIDDDRLVREPLFREKFLLVVPRKLLSNPEAADRLKNDINLKEIIGCPFILLTPGNRTRDLFDIAMRSEKLTPNILMETDNAQTAFELAQKEMAMTVYSDMFLNNYHGTLNKDVLILPFDKYMPSDLLHVYYNAGSMSSRYKTGFLHDLHQAFISR